MWPYQIVDADAEVAQTTLSFEVPFGTHSRQDCIVVLPYLVSGHCGGAFRPVARNLAQLVGNKRDSWPCFTFEHSK